MLLKRLPADAPLLDLIETLEKDGGLVIEGMFPKPVIAQMAEAVRQHGNNHQPGKATQGKAEDGKAFVGANTTRFSSLGKVSPAYFEMLDNSLFKQLTDAALSSVCGAYWVNTGQAMLIGPGSKAQVLHRDCMNWPQYCEPLWPNCPEITLSAMIALEDIDEEVGATRIMPGSHVWKDEQDQGTQAQTVPAELKVGDALIYSGKLLHGGGANQTSDRWRHAMHLSFLAGWLTPEEACPLDYTSEELAPHSEHVRRVLGHSSYDPRPQPGGGLWLKHVREW